MKKSAKPTIDANDRGLMMLSTPRNDEAWMCRLGFHWASDKGSTWTLMSNDKCKKTCRRKDCPGPRRVRLVEKC